MRFRFIFSTTLVGIAIALIAHAEITPPVGAADPRIRQIAHDPMNVVRLVTHFGTSTHIQLNEDEKVIDVAIGDSDAWQVAVRGRHLFIKPKEAHADTNLTVVTSKRVYQFALVLASISPHQNDLWADRDLVYSLSFTYPAEDQKRLAAEAEVRKTKDLLAHPVSDTSRVNTNYWGAGSRELMPTAAKDDGKFIYLTFSGDRDMPAVYSVDDKGAESLINTHVQGDTIVVQRLVPRLKLRKGEWEVCIENRSFRYGAESVSTSPKAAPVVKRVLKGEDS